MGGCTWKETHNYVLEHVFNLTRTVDFHDIWVLLFIPCINGSHETAKKERIF